MLTDEEVSAEMKEANAYLREKFLCFISSICSQKDKLSTIQMCENTRVTGNLTAVDANFENIIVENLQTPLPAPLKLAVLRATDILTITVDNK